MRRPVAVAVVATGVLAGGIAGATFSPVDLVGAQADPPEEVFEVEARPGTWINAVLEPLVEDGTIDQTQADAVRDALIEAVPPPRLQHRLQLWQGRHSFDERLDRAVERGRITEERAEELRARAEGRAQWREQRLDQYGED